MANKKRLTSFMVILLMAFSVFWALLCIETASAETFDNREWKVVFSEDFETTAGTTFTESGGDSGYKKLSNTSDYTGTSTTPKLSEYSNTGDYLGTQFKRLAQGKSIGPRYIHTKPSLVEGYDTSVVKIELDIARSSNARKTVTVIAVQGDLVSGTTNSESVIAHIDNEQWLFSLEDAVVWKCNNGTWIEGEDHWGKQWYHFTLIIDCDTDKFDLWRDGVKIASDYGVGVDFSNINSLKIAAKKIAEDDKTYATYIDNISFSVLSVTPKSDIFIIPGADEFKLRAVTGGEAAGIPNTAKAHIALYGNGGILLDHSIINFSDSMETKNFQKTYNGIAPKYSKLFIWNGLTPEALPQKSAIVIPYAGSNGKWWVENYDTGISSSNQSVIFRINPITYFLEASYNAGVSWTKLSYRADSSYAAEYNYPMEKREILTGTIRDKDNIYMNTNYKYSGALIPVEDSVFDTLTITKGENSIGYAFLAAKPEVFTNGDQFKQGYSPTYAAGYTRVIYTDNQQITLTIPDNARYLYVYNNSLDEMWVPSAVKFSKSGNSTQNSNSVRIATWNIGHFSLGVNSSSSIASADFASKRAEYEDYIYNAINADVISLNEYSAYFIKDSQKAKDTIFSRYPICYEGVQRKYSCNAVYAKSGRLSNMATHEFECYASATGSGIVPPNYYYITSDLLVNGKTVKLVSVHLYYQDEPQEYAKQAINELINTFKNDDRVILMGDWNSTYNKFQIFADAGYGVANTDSLLATYSPCQGSKYDTDIVDGYGTYDNIIYKGVNISDFALAGCKLSDHYAIYCTVTVD